MEPEIADAVSTSIWSNLLTIGGFLLALFAIARLMREKRQPGNTLGWLLVIVLIPWIGVPLYLMFAGRKIKQLAARKDRVNPSLPDAPAPSAGTRDSPAVRTMVANGAGEPVGGNDIRLITDGQNAFAELQKGILEAQTAIHITTFILGREDTGKRIIALLAAKAREGVKVRLLLDALGCFVASRGFCDELREAGGEVARFMPVVPLSTRFSANLRNHRKIAIFDHCTAIVGGHNLAREYMGPEPWDRRFVDFGAVINGPAVGLLNEVFLADWAFASGTPLEELRSIATAPCPLPAAKGDLQVIASGPDVNGDPLYEGIVSMIHEAEHSVWIITPYFIPDEVLQRSLLIKARAGKDVTLIVPENSNHPITDHARRHYLRELDQAGARILLYQPRMLHAKAMIVDDTIAVFGSANFDLRSLFVNFEIGIASYSPADVAKIRVWAGDLVRDCVTYHPGRPRRYPVLSSLGEDLSRLLAPLL